MRLEPGKVNAVRTGSIRNWNPCKNFEHDQNFFFAVSYFRNPSGIIDTGHDTVLILYGPGLKSAVCDCIPGMQTS
jgi:hypothetical protein